MKEKSLPTSLIAVPLNGIWAQLHFLGFQSQKSPFLQEQRFGIAPFPAAPDARKVPELPHSCGSPEKQRAGNELRAQGTEKRQEWKIPGEQSAESTGSRKTTKFRDSRSAGKRNWEFKENGEGITEHLEKWKQFQQEKNREYEEKFAPIWSWVFPGMWQP